MEPGSTRYLGATEAAGYRVGLDGEDIRPVQFLAGTQVAGTSCAGAGVSTETGVVAGTGAPGVSATGLLVPGGSDLADAAAGEERVGVADDLAAAAGGAGEGSTSPGGVGVVRSSGALRLPGDVPGRCT